MNKAHEETLRLMEAALPRPERITAIDTTASLSVGFDWMQRRFCVANDNLHTMVTDSKGDPELGWLIKQLLRTHRDKEKTMEALKVAYNFIDEEGTCVCNMQRISIHGLCSLCQVKQELESQFPELKSETDGH